MITELWSAEKTGLQRLQSCLAVKGLKLVLSTGENPYGGGGGGTPWVKNQISYTVESQLSQPSSDTKINTRRTSPNVGSFLVKRRRRWPRNDPTSGQPLALAVIQNAILIHVRAYWSWRGRGASSRGWEHVWDRSICLVRNSKHLLWNNAVILAMEDNPGHKCLATIENRNMFMSIWMEWLNQNGERRSCMYLHQWFFMAIIIIIDL